MTWRRFREHKASLLSADDLERIHELALGILAKVGVLVSGETLHETARRAGLRARGQRIVIADHVASEYVGEHRGRLAAQHAQPSDSAAPLTLGVSPYHNHLLDPESGQIVPFTSDRLVDMTKFVDTLTERCVIGTVPGCPADVPPALQPLQQYLIGAEYSRHGGALSGNPAPWVAGHILDMAEVMGAPIRGLPVYLVSPLHLAGDSLAVALHLRERVDHLHVSGMPAAGATAPIEPLGALALAAAEAIGSAIILARAVSVPVFFSVAVFPFDLRRLTMAFGSPESLLLRLASADLNHYYGHPADRWGIGDLYVMSKEIGPQAAAEKASLMTAAALVGERSFGGAGSLSMDDIFSPLQLLIDSEIRDHVERLTLGLCLEDAPRVDWTRRVREGISRGFMALDSTLDKHQYLYWYPRLFDRSSLGTWQDAGSPQLLDQARQQYQHLLSRYSYTLDADKRRALHAIWDRAVHQALR